MDNFKSSVMTGDIASAMKLCSYVKWIKSLLALVVSIAYLLGSP